MLSYGLSHTYKETIFLNTVYIYNVEGYSEFQVKMISH